jgi:hypothetical protein
MWGSHALSLLGSAYDAAVAAGALALSDTLGRQVTWDLSARYAVGFVTFVTDFAAEYAIGLVGVAIAVWAGRRAWGGQPARLARTALILAVVAAVTIPAFWAGWSNVFGAVAVGLALESRRRVGSLGAAAGTALILGSVAFLAGTVACALG